jgi:hypothetical protein
MPYKGKVFSQDTDNFKKALKVTPPLNMRMPAPKGQMF